MADDLAPLSTPRFWSHECWASGFDGESRVDEITVDPCPDCGKTQEQAASEAVDE